VASAITGVSVEAGTGNGKMTTGGWGGTGALQAELLGSLFVAVIVPKPRTNKTVQVNIIISWYYAPLAKAGGGAVSIFIVTEAGVACSSLLSRAGLGGGNHRIERHSFFCGHSILRYFSFILKSENAHFTLLP
jgi:hypothetical protein